MEAAAAGGRCSHTASNFLTSHNASASRPVVALITPASSMGGLCGVSTITGSTRGWDTLSGSSISVTVMRSYRAFLPIFLALRRSPPMGGAYTISLSGYLRRHRTIRAKVPCVNPYWDSPTHTWYTSPRHAADDLRRVSRWGVCVTATPPLRPVSLGTLKGRVTGVSYVSNAYTPDP